jgi:hypothetical protein
MYIERIIEARSCNHCCSGKVIRMTYSQCLFVTLVIQHVMRMRGIMLSSVASLALSQFSTLSYKR